MIVRVWCGLARRGRCRACRATVKWVTTDENKTLAFDLDAVPLRRDVDARTSVRFDVYDTGVARHVCRRRTSASNT